MEGEGEGKGGGGKGEGRGGEGGVAGRNNSVKLNFLS